MLRRRALWFGVACLVTLAAWFACFPISIDPVWHDAVPAGFALCVAFAAWVGSRRLRADALSAAWLFFAYCLLIQLLQAAAPSPFGIAVALQAAAGMPAIILVARGFRGMAGFSAAQSEQIRRSSEALRLNEHRWRELLERADVALFSLHAQGLIGASNRAFAGMTGAAPGQLTGLPLETKIAHEDREKFREALRNAAAETDVILELSLTAECAARAILVSLRRLPDGSVECIARDLTISRILEERIQAARQHEAMALLARGIAHDFTNLLTVMHGYLEILRPQVMPALPNTRYLSELEESVRRATALTGKLLAYGKPGSRQQVRVDVNELVRQIAPLLRRMAGEERRFELNLDASAALILADPVQIEQALMNLVLNARDATEQGCIITVAARILPDGRTELAVSDTGSGMDIATQSRVFDPFFTTKPKGNGIGLATVKAIVRENDGTISVTSEPGQGTTVRLVFPAAPAVTGEHRKSWTVLVVDDEQSVRKLVQSILVKSGYSVISAADGVEALEKLSLDKFGVDLLLSDVRMPGLNGHQLARQVRSFIPNLRILMMSGFNTEDAVARTEWPLIQKPFTPKALLSRVEQILAEGGSSSQASG